MYFNKLLNTLWGVLWPTAKKKKVPTKSRMRDTMIKFFLKKSFALVYLKHYRSTSGRFN